MSKRAFSLSLLLLTILCLLLPANVFAQQRPKKKIVEYGWDVPYPDFVRDNIRQMEKRPFEGIIFRTKGFDHIFDTRPWKQDKLQPQLDTLAQIKWKKFTDNFLTLYAASKWKMDWFNDEPWNVIVENMKLFSLAVRRGRQFIIALQQHMPEIRVLSFFQLGLFGHIVDEPDPKIRREKLRKQWMPLLPAFCIGMLEGAAPGTILIDGNESAYYYESPHKFYKDYHLIRQRAQTLVPQELRKKYNSHVQVGMALYIDQALGKRTVKTISQSMSREQQLKFFEHNVYYALTTSDEYVWCYSERMNWWLPPEKLKKDRILPPAVEQALISARQKYDLGKPLGYDIKDMVEAARKKKK
jgi:hypothetical protein